jgi:hypothetical protein
MASISELAVAKRLNFLLLGTHAAIDFANSLVSPPGHYLDREITIRADAP